MTRTDAQRQRMVIQHLHARGITDERVLAAFERVEREAFVPDQVAHAYDDAPLSIGHGQTISQPYVVALMAQALALRGDERVLEIGTGSGYAAAILARLAREVVTVERIPDLADSARERLDELGFANVRVFGGDGSLGWPPGAPYDGIMVAAAAPQAPRSLLHQLAIGGRLVIPTGSISDQVLLRITRHGAERFVEENLGEVRFVPLVGAEGWPG